MIDFLKWHGKDKGHDIGMAFNNLGNVYRSEDKYDSALYYFKKALVYDKPERCQIRYYNIARTYKELGSLDSMVYYLNRSVKNREGRRYNLEYIIALADLRQYDHDNRTTYNELLADLAIERRAHMGLEAEKAKLELAIHLTEKQRKDRAREHILYVVGIGLLYYWLLYCW